MFRLFTSILIIRRRGDSVYIFHCYRILWVYEMASVVFHYNSWWNLFLPVNANFVLDKFQDYNVIEGLYVPRLTTENIQIDNLYTRGR